MAKEAKKRITALNEDLLDPDPTLPSPVQAYLNSLSPNGRRTQATALNNLASIFSDGKVMQAENRNAAAVPIATRVSIPGLPLRSVFVPAM